MVNKTGSFINIFFIYCSIILILGPIASVAQGAMHDETALKTITSIGNQIFHEGTQNERTLTYFRVVEGWSSTSCAFGVMYFDPKTEIGQAWYTSLLVAKASGHKVSRVIYENQIDASGLNICTVSQILEIQ